MVRSHLQVVQDLKQYASPKAKITRLLKQNKLIQLKRGLFLDIDDSSYSLKSIASVIYGPSYVSFESALSFHSLIPERVKSITCAAYNKNKNREFHTPVGDFYFYYVPAEAYPHEILYEEENGQNFLIASPEKAICDSIYKIKGIDTLDEIGDMLLENWRMDSEDLKKLNISVIRSIAPYYRNKSCNMLVRWFEEVLHE